MSDTESSKMVSPEQSVKDLNDESKTTKTESLSERDIEAFKDEPALEMREENVLPIIWNDPSIVLFDRYIPDGGVSDVPSHSTENSGGYESRENIPIIPLPLFTNTRPESTREQRMLMHSHLQLAMEQLKEVKTQHERELEIYRVDEIQPMIQLDLYRLKLNDVIKEAMEIEEELVRSETVFGKQCTDLIRFDRFVTRPFFKITLNDQSMIERVENAEKQRVQVLYWRDRHKRIRAEQSRIEEEIQTLENEAIHTDQTVELIIMIKEIDELIGHLERFLEKEILRM